MKGWFCFFLYEMNKSQKKGKKFGKNKFKVHYHTPDQETEILYTHKMTNDEIIKTMITKYEKN